MNKKFKIAIPFAVLALSCGIAAAGCGGHTHEYTKYGHNETQHWRECECGDVDKSSQEDHLFIAGECECGATEQTGSVEEAKYGKVTGKVKLTKYGNPVTDNAVLSEIKVDMGDDLVKITGSAAEGAYSFTATNVKVGKGYTLKVSCDGYKSSNNSIMLEAEGEEVKFDGADSITLEFEVFTSFWDYDIDLHDLSHVNDANPTIGVNGELDKDGNGTKTLNVISTEKYDDVSATIHAKSSNAGVVQGLLMKFEDGKAAIFNLKTDQSLVQFRPATFGVLSIFDPLNVEGKEIWKESAGGTVTAADKAKFDGDGVDVTLTRKGGTLYAFVDGRFVYSIALPEGYEDDKIQVGLFAFAVKPNAVWSYNITDEVPEMKSVLDIAVNQEGTEGCTVTPAPQQEAYDLDEEVELTITAAEGYKLNALTVGGENMFGAVKDGKLKIKANKLDLKIEATFVEQRPIALDITVKGKKLGATVNLESGKTVKFNNGEYSFVVGENGKISNESVLVGHYIVHVDGYFDKEIDFDEDFKEIVLEYDLFEVVNYDAADHDFAHVNEEDGYIAWKGALPTMNAVTKENILGDTATISVTVKGGTSKDNSKEQGIIMRFEDGKAAAVNINVDSVENARLQFRPHVCDKLFTVFGKDKWVEFKNVTPEEVAKYNSDDGIVLKAVREGKYIYVFIDDVYHGTATLPDEYADDKMGFGFFAFGVQNPNAQWHYTVSETAERASATVTDETAADAKGSLSGVPANAVKVGDKVTLNIAAETGFKLKKLTVAGVDVTAQVTGTAYEFAVLGNTAVAAEFTEIIPGSINAQVLGYKFAVNGNALTASAAVTLSASGFEDVTATLTANGNDTVLTVESIAAGAWTVSIAGYKSAEITIEENGEYTAAIVLQHEEEFSLIQPWGNVGSVIAADGSADLTITNESETAVSSTTFGDIAVTATLCSSDKMLAWDKDKGAMVTGNQGIVFRFPDDKFVVLRMEHRDKIQFAYTEWYQKEGSADGSGWQDLIFFTDKTETTEKDKYLTAFDAGTLKLTAVRKGATIYAILTVDGKSEIIGCRTFADKYFSDNAKVGMYCGNTNNGGNKTWKFATGDADAALAAATPAVGADKVSYLGSWTENEGKLAVSGKGVIMFNAAAGTVKESVKINISAKNGTAEQGIVYNFADGKYVAIRYQNDKGAYKVQFTMDTVLFTNASLINWDDYYMTAVEAEAFDGAGIDLTLTRNGNKFYVFLGDRLLDAKPVDETKYANANGNMGIMLWDGKNAAFAYEHKTGEAVVIPTTRVVTASFDGDAHGYALSYTRREVVDGDTITLTVRTDNADSAWKHFPSAITVDGTAVDFSTVVRESLGANRCQYTLTIENVTADKTITVTVTEGTKVSYDASVNDEAMGSIKCDMTQTDPTSVYHNLYYWNDLCTLMVTANEGYELESLVIGEGADAVTITKDSEKGWTKSGQVYTYGHLVTGNIKVVANFRAVESAAE